MNLRQTNLLLAEAWPLIDASIVDVYLHRRPTDPWPFDFDPPVPMPKTHQRLADMPVGSRLSIYGYPFGYIDKAKRRALGAQWHAERVVGDLWIVERVA